MRHTVVISDIHLSEVDPGSGEWMRYRQREFLPDGDIARMLGAVRREIREQGGGELHLVLDGDVFDFDAPRVVEGESVFHDLPRRAEHGVPALAAILDDHPIFVAALGHVLAEGHRIVVISGNHDVELGLPEVRALLVERVVGAATWALEAYGARRVSRAERAGLAARIAFRGWFHRTDDGIVIEHGHQYDSCCSHRCPMAPFGERAGEIEPAFGSLVARHIVARLGTFNPHDDGTFIMTPLGYVAHWARHYLFTRRSLLVVWLQGIARAAIELCRRRRIDAATRRDRRRAGILAAAHETGAPLPAVARHARLFAEPIGERPAHALRELFVDRVAVAIASLALALAVMLSGVGSTKVIAALTPLFFVAYARCTPRPLINEGWRRVSAIAHRIARIHGARAVVLGHTHTPEGRWEDGLFVGNSGSWSAAVDGDRPAKIPRPVVWLKSDPGRPGSALAGGLYLWVDGRFEPQRARAPGSPGELPAPEPASASDLDRRTPLG